MQTPTWGDTACSFHSVWAENTTHGVLPCPKKHNVQTSHAPNVTDGLRIDQQTTGITTEVKNHPDPHINK